MFIGERLKQLRIEKNMTQIDLAKEFNTTHSTINRYEKGIHQPDTETLNRLADFFNVTTDYLLGRTDIRNNAERISEAIKDDNELLDFWTALKGRPDLQLLFKQTRYLSDKDIKQVLKIIMTFENEEGRND